MILSEEHVFKVCGISPDDVFKQARTFAESYPYKWMYRMPKLEHISNPPGFALWLIKCNAGAYPQYAPDAVLFYAGELEYSMTFQGICPKCHSEIELTTTNLVRDVICNCGHVQYGFQYVINHIYSNLQIRGYHMGSARQAEMLSNYPFPMIPILSEDIQRLQEQFKLHFWKPMTKADDSTASWLAFSYPHMQGAEDQHHRHMLSIAITELYKAVGE